MVTDKKIKFKHRLEFVFYQSFFLLVKFLPFSWSAWIGKWIALFGFRILKPRRLLTIENIRNAREKGYLPAGTNDYQLAKQVWKHLGYTSAEFLYYCAHGRERIQKSVQLIGEENLKRVLAKKKVRLWLWRILATGSCWGWLCAH